MTGAFAELLRAPRFSAVQRWSAGGEEWLLGETAATRSLYAAGGDAVHLDLEGRWQRARLEGATYLRGYDGRVLHRLAGPRGQDLTVDPPMPVHTRVEALLARAAPGAPPALEAAQGWSAARLEAEAERFLTVYRPVGVLPPDRYRSLLLQATHGCAFNGCLFCSLYKGQPYQVPGREAFRAHVQAVKAFLGSGLEGRRGIFLGEANALGAPLPVLEDIFSVLEAEVPHLLTGHEPSRGVSCFVDAFTAFRSAGELAALRERGLSRVFLGVESGDAETLALLGKPAQAKGVRDVVEAAHQARVSVGLTLLVGLGERHARASVELVRALGLAHEDVVYLSPLRLEAHGPLARQLEARGFALPAPDALHAEYARLHHALAGQQAQVARYDVSRFVYA